METHHSHPRTIVVGIDFGQAGEFALREAAQLARDMGPATLCLVHVLTPGDMHKAARAQVAAGALNDELTQLESYARAAAHQPPLDSLPVECQVRVGDPAVELSNVANDLRAELIVVGSNERHTRKHGPHDKLPHQLLDIASVPVVVAREQPAPAPAAPVPEPERKQPEPRHVHLEFVNRNQHISGLL